MKPAASGDSIRRIDGRGTTMATLPQLLASRAADRPVVDATGLEGEFAFRLEWGLEPESPSVYRAVQQQLGLKLEPRRMPTDVIRVTRADRIPSPN